MGMDEPKGGLLQYMVGWRKGSHGGAYHPDEMADPHFQRGYEAGREARKAAYAAAVAEYGYELSVLRVQSD